MRIAIFSDIHGKILLPFKMVACYQKETGNKVDCILQCGDIGAYPNPESLDKATKKHALNNIEELGFYNDFTKMNQTIKAFLDELDINMFCVRGNHEDHNFLDGLEKMNFLGSRFPIDIYKRVFVCKTGLKQELRKENEILRFVGIGRIGNSEGRKEKRFIQDYEIKELKKLLHKKDGFDILLTHDKASTNQIGYGMAEIREVLDHVTFKYHFYGHTGEPFKQETDRNGSTQTVKVRELVFNESGMLEKGCMLVLTKESGVLNLEVVDQKWTNSFTIFYWKAL